MRTIVMLCTILTFAQAQPPKRPVAQPPPPQPTTVSVTGQEPAAVLNAESSWAGAGVLLPLVTSSDRSTRMYALRALGRLEDPRLVPQLLAMVSPPNPPDAAVADAIAQSLHGFDPTTDPALSAAVSATLLAMASTGDPLASAPYLIPLGRIRYATAEEVHSAERLLRTVMDRTQNSRILAGVYYSAAVAIDALARVNARTTRFETETSAQLSRIVAHTAVNDGDDVRAFALSALMAGGSLEAGTQKTALKDESPDVRRLATTVLAGAGGGIEDAERVTLLEEHLSDPSPFVRYEAVRGYVRRGGSATNGCGRLVDLLDDPDSHVVLAAIDAFADACRADEAITTRLVSELRVPQPSGAWNRDAHLYLTLAKRAPQTIEIPMEAFVTHPAWWVRMYAARAAAAMDDVVRLGELAYDQNDNVRDAALGPLRRLDKEKAEPATIAALARADYQLVRDAAQLLKDSPVNDKLAGPLIAALLRITNERKETSRDVRLPLLDAIRIHAPPGAAEQLMPLLKDFDPVVAGKAADVITRLTGKTVRAEPATVLRGWPTGSLRPNLCVAVTLESHAVFYLQMNSTAAPITVARFLQLAATDHYYDGLTFHRVVPNFVVQGGSPGANEYAGHKDYMRDEISATNERGTVGLSTRGRNTADAQFFINLVDNHRLDYDYTVFAKVIKGMDVVDGIEEGAQIRRIELSPSCGRKP
jgi:cyclophilin family peptidyl-prolyl cis-trans isomerase/HEAT repeat protein